MSFSSGTATPSIRWFATHGGFASIPDNCPGISEVYPPFAASRIRDGARSISFVSTGRRDSRKLLVQFASARYLPLAVEELDRLARIAEPA
jgi:hypothetical protein